MNSDPTYARYVSARVHLYRQLDAIRVEVDAWLADIATRQPTMSDLARLEVFHAQRQRALTELQEAEERFLDHLVSQIGNVPAADGVHSEAD